MKMPNNFLLMMNSENDFSHFKSMVHAVVSADCSVDWVADHDAGMEIVAKNAHDIWLIDAELGSRVVCDVVREGMKTGGKAPFIILHDETNLAIALDAMKLGASDALNKQQTKSSDLERTIHHTFARHHYVALERQANDQLITQNQELNALCKTAQEYAGHVSYKIRTPLTVIKAFAAILADGVAGQLNTKQIEHLKKIIARVDDLSDMLGEMIKSEKARAQGTEALTAVRIEPVSKPGGSDQPPQTTEPQPAVMAAPPPPALSDSPPAVMAAAPPPAMSSNQPGDDVVAPVSAANQPIKATEAPEAPEHTVLIVDDDPTIIEVFSMLIENLGFNVITATNGRDGFAQFASKNVDLLILDLGIPGDDGLSIYQKILDLEFAELERTPAILLTGSSEFGRKLHFAQRKCRRTLCFERRQCLGQCAKCDICNIQSRHRGRRN